MTGTTRITLVAALLWLAGPVWGATLEQLVMPGPLIEGHADLETDCDNCHRSFERTAQDALCLGCHKEVREDVDRGTGFHGLSRARSEETCQACHTDHRGRAADIVALNAELFDHTETDFRLEGRHIGVACAGCHEPDQRHRDTPRECVACHRDDEPHQGRLGEKCGNCHDVGGWKTVTFDHDTTDFRLTGAHRDTACAACHVNEVYQDLDRRCVSCHALDDKHGGTRGDDCGNCHDTARWEVERFDHAAKTGFALEGRHAELECPACHLADMARPEPPDTCAGCHSVDDVHAGRHGSGCADCHGVVRWDDVRFDHFAKTEFELRGMHGQIACTACHVGRLEDPLPRTCDECHADDDPHDGTQSSCGRCHSESSWHDVRFNHDFTHFPLIGQHRTAACESCHTDVKFTDTQAACVGCHRQQDSHEGALGEDCGRCHNPNSWNRWEFDHNVQSGFALDGAHRSVRCDACHRPGGALPMELSMACVSCHHLDDAHDGRFGPDCASCHTTESFSALDKFQ